MRAIITGATAAIGTALIKELTENGYDVTCVCRRDSQRNDRITESDRVHRVFAELDEYKLLPDICGTGYDSFFHLAWARTDRQGRNDVGAQTNNIRFTLDAAQAAHDMGCSVFVGAGSQAEYGRVEGVISPSTPAFPEIGYGIAKLAAGQLTRLLCSQIGVRHIWARIFSVYGPNNDGSMITSTIEKLLSGETPEFTPAEQMWDFMYSADCARALRMLAEGGTNGKVYCLASGDPRPLKEYIEIMRDVIDPSLPLGIGRIPYSANQVMNLSCDISDLQRDVGFSAGYSFEEGIRLTAESMRNRR